MLMVASVPLSLVLVFATFAAGPALHSSAVANPGSTITVDGTGFRRNTRLTMLWDSSANGMPAVRSDRDGSFRVAVVVPRTASIGPHVITVVETNGKKVGGAAATKGRASSKPAAAPSGPVATLTIQVQAASIATPSPTLRATPTPRPTATPTLQATPTPTPRATPTPTPTPGSAAVSHVFVVVMENHAANQVYGTSATPYTTGLANTFARASNYFAITHPSLPNYLDMYGGSNYGITNDCNPSSSCHVNARNLADNLEAAGLTWKGYFESMSTPCAVTDGGGYIAHHNPFVYFDDIRTNATRCRAHVVNYSALSGDLASASTTPNFVFIVPNNCNNTHSCPISTGDVWLSAHLPAILNSPACTTQRCLLMLTWDEDNGSQGNQVLTVFAGSAAKTGYMTSTRYDHFSLLRTIEALFRLPTQTTRDAAATPMTEMLR
jgi:hypothetical protein